MRVKLIGRVKRFVFGIFVPKGLFELQEVVVNAPMLAAEIPRLKVLGKSALFWSLFSEIALVAQIYPVKIAVDYWNTGAQMTAVRVACLAISVAFLLGNRINVRASNARNSFVEFIRVLMWSEAHRKQLDLDVSWHIQHGTGEKDSIIMRNADLTLDYLVNFIFINLKDKFRITLIIKGMLIFMPWYGLLATVVVALYAGILMWHETRLAAMSAEYHSDLRMLNEYGSELSANCLTIKGLALEGHFAQKNREKLEWVYDREVRRHKTWRNFISRPERVVDFAKGAIYLLGFETAGSGGSAFTMGSFFLAVGWTERAFSNLYSLSEFQDVSRRGIPAIRELVKIFRIKPQVVSPPNAVWKDNWTGGVKFRNVSFTYKAGSGPTLRNINLVVKPNTMVGIVGMTGCGKSTLLRLLQLNYYPDEGSIEVDGVDIRTLDHHLYKRNVLGVVSQDIQLFQGTIRENIRLSRMDAPAGEEEEAVRQAYAEEFILKLPGGYDHVLGENGATLSGGQRQRLVIARALHGRSRILILDEPTSSLDSKSQLHVQRALSELMKSGNCTTFVIAHRFSTIRDADMIVVMDEGEIVEVGSHEELMRMNGFYARLLQLDQEGGFASEEEGVLA